MDELSGALLEIRLDDLIFYERCGGGTYGSVYRAHWRSQNLTVAVKRLLVLEKEAQVLSLISHKNIIKFYGAVSKDPDFCLVTDYAPNGSLYAFLRKPDSALDFKLIVKWATEIATGVHYLHWESPVKIIHRDLKSKNVVISEDWTCKLCDFGASRFAVNTTKMTLAGTFPWMSPEAIQSMAVSESTDVWSYGVVLWELLTREIPFNGIEGFQVAWLIVEKGQRLTIPTTCPPSFRRLLERCWQNDPKSRPNLKQILALLSAMLVEESLPELTNSFLDHKMVWKEEIEATLDQLKKAELAISNKEQELMEREMKVKEREKSLVQQLNIVKLEDHDVKTWRDVDVYQWVMQLCKSGHTSDLAQYAEMFLTNHITGRRLLSITGEHLKDIGISSVGHRMDLLHEIEVLKTHNFRLINFPPLAKNAETVVAVNQVTKEMVSVTLVFGHHLRKGSTDEETKWKMYAEIDQDEDEDTTALTLVKEVTFICKMPDFGTFTLTHPPFIMSTWCLGVVSNMSVECIITYEPYVHKPKSTHFLYQVDGRNPTSRQQSIVLTLNKLNQKTFTEDDSGSLASVPVSPAHTNTTFSLTSNTSQTNLQGAWSKSFFPVELPPNRSPSKSKLWSSVVSGKRQSISKPIPGTTEYINDYPNLTRSSSNSKSLSGKSETSSGYGPEMVTPESKNSKIVFSLGGESVTSSFGKIHRSESVLSGASRNTDSVKSGQNPYNTDQVSGTKTGMSSGRPLSAGDREKGGERRRIMFEEEERPWMGRQLSKHSRSLPNKNTKEYNAHPNYRRAFSGGLPSSRVVYLTGAKGYSNNQHMARQKTDRRNNRGNLVNHPRDGNNSSFYQGGNAKSERGNYNGGKGNNKRSEDGCNYPKQVNGHAGSGSDQKDWRTSSKGGKRSERKNTSEVKTEMSKLSVTGSAGSDAQEAGWTQVGKKKS